MQEASGLANGEANLSDGGTSCIGYPLEMDYCKQSVLPCSIFSGSFAFEWFEFLYSLFLKISILWMVGNVWNVFESLPLGESLSQVLFIDAPLLLAVN